MQRVLFIAYYFPPLGGSGVYRSAKFAKYLPQFGWQPYVLGATDEQRTTEQDHSLLVDIPDEVQVWRVATPQPQPGRRLRHLVRRLSSQVAGSSTSGEIRRDEVAHVNARAAARRRVKRFLSWPLRKVQAPPIDRQLYWSLRVIPLATRMIRRHNIDLIYTSSSPYSVLLTGSALRSLTGRPWVADLRDPWTTNDILYHEQGAQLALDQAIEKRLLGIADSIVCVNRSMVDTYGSVLGDESKFSVIPNGFDPDDVQRETQFSAFQTGKRILALFGTVSPQAASTLIEMAAHLRRISCSCEAAPCEIHLHARWMDTSDRAKMAHSGDIDCLLVHEPRPHAEAVSLMRQADALLLFIHDSPYGACCHPGKLFEYMASGVPILAIAPEGAATQLIRESGTGCTVHPKDLDGLLRILTEIASDYAAFRERVYRPRADVIQRFDRRLLTRRLAEVFDLQTMTRE